MDTVFWVGMIAAGIRLATPIALAALGEVLAERSGVLNVGIEGIMLVGGFLAVLFAVLTGSPWAGLGAAMAGGALLGAVQAWFAVTLKVDQIVSGIALILLGLGLSGYGFRLTLGGSQESVQVPGFQRLDFGWLTDLPVLGPILFSHHVLVYACVILAPLLLWFLQRTHFGLAIRSVGENPRAADAAGVNVDRVRWSCVVSGGVFAGMAGASLSIAQLSGFVEDMVQGRGFIAIACVVFARWNPVGAVVVALAFGIADAAQFRFQSQLPDVPYQLFTMVPYAVAIIALVAASRSAAAPAALTRPYRPAR